MTLKKLAVAVSLAICAAGALAEDFTFDVTLSNSGPLYSGNFGATHTELGAFTDTINFLPADIVGMADSILSNISFNPRSDIDFTSVFLNGVPLTLSVPGDGEFAFTFAPFAVTGPLQLIVNGVAGPDVASGPFAGSYSGTLNVSAIPEPETYAMMLGGLALVGFVARRRKPGGKGGPATA